MTWKEWRFSAHYAWQNRFIRSMLIINGGVIFFVSAWMLWRLIPEGMRAGVLVLHSNIYLGIDEVKPWPWIFLFPIGIILAFGVNAIAAFTVFREEELAAKTLVTVSASLTALWVLSIFFLVLVNM